MLRKLRIQNFKGWKDTGDIRMAPLTIFFGANSSGKSSIGQFLMMLKQTVESPDRKIVIYSGGKNTAVYIGSFNEFVYSRDTSNSLEFEYTWETEKPLKAPDTIPDKRIESSVLTFKSAIKQASNQNSPYVDSFEYSFETNNSSEVRSIGMQKASDKLQYKLTTCGIGVNRNKGRAWPIKPPIRFYGFPDEVVAYHQNAEFVKEYNLAQETLFKSIQYLGPLRSKADRLYTWAGVEPENVGYAGESTIPALLAAKGRKINFGKKKNLLSFQEVIASKLTDMGLIESFEVSQVSDLRQEYEVRILSNGSQLSVDLPDVGFGISQVLPVIVQLFYAQQNSIIIMEQPEIHLHPKAQAALADVMIDALNSREKGSDRNIQLIVETHSEHFLRRLQRRIAEGDKITTKDVSTYFANTGNTPSTLDELSIDEYGSILNWPENFFGDDVEDIIAQTEAATKKISQKGR